MTEQQPLEAEDESRFGVVQYTKTVQIKGFFHYLVDPLGRQVAIRIKSRDGPITIPISSCIIEEKVMDRNVSDYPHDDGV